MDTSVRKNIAARDAAPAGTGGVARRLATAPTLMLIAGFAHPPYPSAGGGSGTGSGAGAPGNGFGLSRAATEGS